MEAAGPHRRAAARRLERLRAETPPPAPPRLRADDGPLRHRPHEDRPQALRDRLPLRQRGTRPHLPHQRPRTANGYRANSLVFSDALAHEAAAVNEIKRHKRFTVVIGNPPYAGISSNMTEHAQHIVDAYRFGRGSVERKESLAAR